MRDAKSYPNARDCEHGRQRGKCVDCDFADADRELDAIAVIPEVDAADGAGVEAVRNAIAKLKAAVAAEREACAALFDGRTDYDEVDAWIAKTIRARGAP